jgi:hypothetical protein
MSAALIAAATHRKCEAAGASAATMSECQPMTGEQAVAVLVCIALPMVLMVVAIFWWAEYKIRLH